MIRLAIAFLAFGLLPLSARAQQEVVHDFLELTNVAGIDVTQATVQDVIWELGPAKLYKMNPTTEDEWISGYKGESRGVFLCYRLIGFTKEEPWTLIFNFDLSVRVKVSTYALLNRKLNDVDCSATDKSVAALFQSNGRKRTIFPNRKSLLNTFGAITEKTKLVAFFTTREFEKTTDLRAVNREMKTLSFAIEDPDTQIYVGVTGRFTEQGRLTQLIVGGSNGLGSANQSRRP